MISNEKILNEREQKRLERKIIKKFLEKRTLTNFEKDSIKMLKAFLYSAYNFYKGDFYKYLKDNEGTLSTLISSLDHESKEVVDAILKDAKFISTHYYVDLIREVFNKEKELMKHIEAVNSYKHLKLYANVYKQSIFGYKHGLIYLPEKRIKTLINKDFIDGGAYIGDSALIFEKYYQPNKIYSFEPDEEYYNSIFETIELNNLKKVVPVKLGIGEKECKANFMHMSTASCITDEDTDLKVEITTIDKYVHERNLDIGLIKMDVEGYELEALKGAKKTIQEFKPVLLISIYHNAEQFINVIKFVQDLNLGYNIIIRHLEDLQPILGTHLIAW